MQFGRRAGVRAPVGILVLSAHGDRHRGSPASTITLFVSHQPSNAVRVGRKQQRRGLRRPMARARFTLPKTAIGILWLGAVSCVAPEGALAADCLHPQMGPDGTTMALGPCADIDVAAELQNATGDPGGGAASFVPFSVLSQRSDLDVTYIERAPRYPSYRRGNSACATYGDPFSWCSQVYNMPSSTPQESSTATPVCEGLTFDQHHRISRGERRRPTAAETW